MDNSCIHLVYDYLNEDEDNIAIIENYMFNPESKFAFIENVQMSSFNSEVYYVLYKTNSENEIFRTIRKSSLVWHFLAVLGTFSGTVPGKLSELDIENISSKARFVITGAYDGEAYIFWKRKK